MNLLSKQSLKQVLGELPWTAEIYWQLRQGSRPLNQSFSLRRIEGYLPAWRAQAGAAALSAPGGKKLLLFSTLRYWVEHAALLSAALAGLGHKVSLAYLPYNNWRVPLNRFDLRRQNLYVQNVLNQLEPLVQIISFADGKANTAEKLVDALPAGLVRAIEEISLRDAQYTLQVEQIDRQDEESEAGRLYRLRLERNLQAAWAAYEWVRANQPAAVIVPNGSILEMGAVYQTTRHLGIPAVTYEFGEQRGRIWLARDTEVMRQETDSLWQAYKDLALDENQWEQVRALFISRQRASLWENFARRWQGMPNQGGEQVRQELGLDGRPVVLLAANVIGDSLTLGRQVFSESMTEWLERSVQFFASRPDLQLVVRIHPGERYTKGPSVADVVKRVLAAIPSGAPTDHIHLVAAGDPVNTYDLVEIADLGLVYTTTVGMEMAMSGVPTIVVGQTHYRGKGFSLDPQSWEAYFELLATIGTPQGPQRLDRQQVERAWHYAYRFFFDYPLPFPWHLLNFWNDIETWTVERALSPLGQAQFGEAFACLSGEPRDWIGGARES